ncbi:MAG: 50S ribosomal protein L29 [Candidatus Latescibacteria bacterium]|jgi:large subunit ribosomal protein L29|nr:50S ribosomal protein L29 [Candidatus Latescibacterota bacterium]MBT4140516.1 50S ribosomal protein L29 [Candidatus Latescibacterota bacterium]MBT5830430.1 50S ribosomal protein L29 [Candidatus Latescibacterota bacterium]
MKPSEIRDLSSSDILEKVQEQEKELANMRIQLTTRQLENPLLIRETRRELARLKTILREQA